MFWRPLLNRGQMLSRFEVLSDKRRGRCWSPTHYADGVTSRGNAGVIEVSALVFDLHRVPPDPRRLAGVHWISHTTWSHTPLAPRWRVVTPLSTPRYQPGDVGDHVGRPQRAERGFAQGMAARLCDCCRRGRCGRGRACGRHLPILAALASSGSSAHDAG